MKDKVHIFMKEWWTTGRTIAVSILAIGGLSTATLATITLASKVESSYLIPYHGKCFTKFNDSVNGPRFKDQVSVNKELYLSMLRVEKRQEVTISNRLLSRADSLYKEDSIKMERRIRYSR